MCNDANNNLVNNNARIQGNLNAAKAAKADEFYTQLPDIEKELKYYKKQFKDKVVFCNCDDPYESNFFKYFAMNFEFLGLKKLICTCYDNSPFAGEEMSLFAPLAETNEKCSYKVEITTVPDYNEDGVVGLDDVETLVHKPGVVTRLNGDGDFRSAECIELLKEADIVVTNPPFSLFREYIAQLVKFNKKFLIIGNQNAITYKEIFPLIKNNKIWLGCSIHNGDREFRVPNTYNRSANYRIDENGNKYIRVRGPRWFTNLDYRERHDVITLYKHYTPEDYPKYDNYDVINVGKTADIPMDYDGIMGVPITFMDKYCPEQFEIIGATQRGCHDLVPDTRKYDDYREYRQNGEPTGSSGGKTNENANLLQNDGKKNYFMNSEGRIVQSLYQRIFIKRKAHDMEVE